MRILLKIVLAVYYLFLALYIVLVLLIYNSTIDGKPLPVDIKIIGWGTTAFFILVLLGGLMNMGTKYRRFFSKKFFQLFLIAFWLWILISALYLYWNKHKAFDFYLISIIPVLPAFLHVLWFYRHYDEQTYDLSKIEDVKLSGYNAIFDLNLPYLKILNQDNEHLLLRIDTPYSLSKVFLTIFLLFWLTAWTFGATMLTTESLWAAFLYLPVLFVIRVFLPLVFTKVYISIKPEGVELKRLPFKQEIHFKDFREVDFRKSCSSRGGCQYYIMRVDNDRSYITLHDKEMLFVIKKLLEAHFLTKNQRI